MRLLFIGDIVGKPGRQIIVRALPGLIAREQLDLVVANAENAAGGSGLTPAIYHELIAAGVDVHHAGRSHLPPPRDRPGPAQASRTSSSRPTFRRDAAGPRRAPSSRPRNGVRVAVFSLLGRVFMRPVDCPSTAADRVLAAAAAGRAGRSSSTSTPRPPATSN